MILGIIMIFWNYIIIDRILDSMNALTKEELKIVEFNILKDVACFCRMHNIRYFLCGGTLLGAIRHNGFIPWDDDIDIMMPREDYQRFFKLYNRSNSRYRADSLDNNPDWHMAFGRVGDTETILFENTLKKKYSKYHAFIDVFPIDGIPDNMIMHKFLVLIQKTLGVIGNASAFIYLPSKHFSDSKEENISIKNKLRTIVKYILITLLAWVPTQKVFLLVNSISKKFNFNSCNNVGLTVYVWNASRKSMLSGIKLKFEESEFWAPKGYDEYLTNTFGDYMTPPPDKNQVSHHNFDVYWLTKSC